jgi:membrane associated rhomboid family serine protease
MAWLTGLDVVNKLLVSIIAVNLFGFLARRRMNSALALVPRESFRIFGLHRLATHAWLHADLPHLFANCAGLYFAGHILRARLATDWKFISVFAIALVLGASIYAVLFYAKRVAVVGVSGAVYGVIAAALFLAPNSGVRFFMYMIPASIAVPAFIVLNLARELRNRSGVAHGLHLTGAIAGFLAAYWLEPESVARTAKLIFAPSLRLAQWLFS